MTNRMANGPRDVAVGENTIKEMWTGLYDQYHGVRWGAESIIFRELVSLRQSECEDTDSYIAKFRAFYLRLTNIEKKLGNWILVYMLFNGLGDEHTGWATTVQNVFRKETEPPEFSIITAQPLNESQILPKSSAGTDTTIGLIGKQFSK